jgi:hypothetical protein
MKKLFLFLIVLNGCVSPSPEILQGPPGTPGTVITTVQFCPNVVSIYPTTFPEYGLCINGNVYAVYSANDGFLTLTPPGTYNSNAIGSACAFTILPNCVIQ